MPDMGVIVTLLGYYYPEEAKKKGGLFSNHLDQLSTVLRLTTKPRCSKQRCSTYSILGVTIMQYCSTCPFNRYLYF